MAAKECEADLAFQPKEEESDSDSGDELVVIHNRGKSAPQHPLEDVVLESGKRRKLELITFSFFS